MTDAKDEDIERKVLTSDRDGPLFWAVGVDVVEAPSFMGTAGPDAADVPECGRAEVIH